MTIRMRYDVTVDALAIEFQPGARTARTIMSDPGIHVDLDAHGRIVTMELLEASERVSRAQLEALPGASEYLTLAEAAEESGLAPATLRVQINRGRLAAVKRGRDWLVDATALFNYLESRDSRGQRTGRRGPAGRKQGHKARARVDV